MTAREARAVLDQKPPELLDRLLALTVEDENNCWVWQGTKANGYGRITIKQWPARVHRVTYEYLVGSIPDAFQVDHLCRNRACCNPDHLEAVPQRINILRSMAPSAVAARTNRCQRGHEFTPENTYVRPDGTGWRQCRECIRIRKQRRQRARRTRAA